MPADVTDEFRAHFERTGYAGPLPIFDGPECRRILSQLQGAPPAVDWFKGNAASSRAYYRLATLPGILDCVAAILGEDVMLWGASLIYKKPGQVHPWHTDIESSAETGRTVTVWIGLANTNAHSSLRLMSYSHTYGITLQERAQKAGKRRGEATLEDVVSWAKAYDSRSSVEQFEMGDGDALFFDGRLWHGSHNSNENTVRTAIILQYATPDTPIRIPDSSVREWPFQYEAAPKPPCIMVRGTDRHGLNRMVAPPSMEWAERPSVSSWLKPLRLPLEEDRETGWKRYPIFRGSTRCIADVSCHVSVLSPGITPHPPHQHPEEEILIMLSGEAELVIGGPSPAEAQRIHEARPGTFVYYPAQQVHTIRNAGAEPITYLMFKWGGDDAGNERPPLQTATYEFDWSPSDPEREPDQGFVTTRVFEGPTRYLRKLHGHVSTLRPGAGYPAHVDAYDVAIIVLTGTVETLGQRVGPHGVIFYSAGEPHGMKNAGDTPASYLVFEFHSAHYGTPRPEEWRLKKLVPRPVKRLARKSLAYLRRSFSWLSSL